MKRPILLTTGLLTGALVLAGCTAATGADSSETTAVVSDADLTPTAVLAENADYTVVNTDEWDESDAVDVDLAGDSADAPDGVTVDGGSVTITEEGTYRLSGRLDGQLVIAAPDDAQVVIILDGVDIAASDGPAIEVQSADDVAIHLADGSVNSVSDAAAYAEDADADAAIYSSTDLTISGSGALSVTGNGGDGINSTDDLVLLGGAIAVTAARDALRGKDSLVIEGGELTLTAAEGDGLHSKGDQDEEEIDWTTGYILVSGGVVDITAADDGMQAFTDLIIAGGEITLSAADDGIKSEATLVIGTLDDTSAPVVEVVESNEGIESANIGISAGEVTVTAADDGVNASGNTDLQALINGESAATETETEQGRGFGGGGFADTGERLQISGGVVVIDAEGDGLDSNGTLLISGGETVVHGPTRGGNGSLDANGGITISGGTVLAYGPGDMEETPDASGQGWVQISAALTAGQATTIVDASGVTVAEFTPIKSAATVTYSSADIVSGETYTVSAGGEELASAVAGESAGAGMAGPGQGGQGAGQGTPSGGMGERPTDMPADMPADRGPGAERGSGSGQTDEG